MITLASGPWQAVIDPHGAALAALTHDGRDLVLRRSRPGEHLPYAGDLLAPWPGRVDRGTYTWEGETHRLRIDDADSQVALHGLVDDREWHVAVSGTDWATLGVRVEDAPGWPFRLGLQLSYTLSADGLSVLLEAFNLGDSVLPWGVGFHPYFTSPDPIDETPLWLPATERLVLDDRLLPAGRVPVPGSAHDFATPRPLGDLVLDDAFDGTPRDDQDRAWMGFGDLRLWWGTSLPWLQLYTPPDRSALAIEPYSCPTGALNTGDDLTRLQPGHAHVSTWGVGLTDAPISATRGR
ncbi:galactose mutarotase [Solicola sp. PLA-1-18]|uniref:aldose epimerase family protein n=1 Tax=Solicola sp. PLA-1-18 TaxID=3380532 RepID=UPI003B823689